MVKKELRKSNKFVVTDTLLKLKDIKELSLNEFLILMYLDNNYTDKLEVDIMSECLSIDSNSCLEAFNSLIMKGLIVIESKKDSDNKITELVNIDNIYKMVELEENNKNKDNSDIFLVFEKELGKPLSSYELETINGWIESGTSEDLIIGALKEAIFNGTSSFRYIDSIIYNWEKQGLKNMDDVNNHVKNRRKENKDKFNKNENLLDYDWLNLE